MKNGTNDYWLQRSIKYAQFAYYTGWTREDVDCLTLQEVQEYLIVFNYFEAQKIIGMGKLFSKMFGGK